MDLDVGKAITRAVWRGGPWNRDFFGPWNGSERSECHLGGKKLRFQGPPLQTAQEIDFPPSKSIRPAPYTCIDVGCRYVRNIGLNKFMSTVEKATVTPHSSKTGETAVLKQVCDLGTDCCWWLVLLPVAVLLLMLCFWLLRIRVTRMIRIRLFTLMLIRIRLFTFYMDPDPGSHQLCESATSGLPTSTASFWASTPPFWASTSSTLSIHKLDFELPRILNFDYLDAGPAFNLDADPDPIFHSDADPDPAFHFVADPDPISKMMLILIRNTGRRCLVTLHLMPCYWCRAVDALI
jgi:hypothetical protein